MYMHTSTLLHIRKPKGRVSFVLSIHLRAKHSDNTCKGPGSCYILDYYPKLEGLTCFFSHSLNYLPLLIALLKYSGSFNPSQIISKLLIINAKSITY